MRIPLAIAFSFLSITALGQVAASLPRPAVSFGARPEVINEPYSADAVTTTVRTLADGTHIARQTMIVKMYRDSAGRTRSDRMPAAILAGGAAPPVTILISDPVAGYSYVLDTANKIARRSVIQRPQPAAVSRSVNLPAPPPPPAPVTRGSQPQFKTEDLGTQFMEGLTVQGRRTTVTYAAGSIGNDRDIVTVSEIWTNTELRLMILQNRTDPRSGETTTKLENVSRAQPDPALFLPPPDYKIVDESAGR